MSCLMCIIKKESYISVCISDVCFWLKKDPFTLRGLFGLHLEYYSYSFLASVQPGLTNVVLSISELFVPKSGFITQFQNYLSL